ncbi:MAG: sensor histidine kinase [Desulfobacteraceae bacterium]|nr:MAG: sensor histidine kinase [Desulfobacteraceae bacterium]
MPWHKSIRATYYKQLVRNMIFTIIGVSFIPVFLVSFTIYYTFVTAYQGKINAHLMALVENHKKQIDSFLSSRLADILFLSESFSYEQLSRQDFLQSKLFLLRNSYGGIYVDMGVVTAEGHQVSYAGPFKLSNVNYAGAPWFQKVMTQQVVVSDVFLGYRGFPHFIVAVRRFEGEQPWILRATIDFIAFNNLVENIRIGETGFAFILNKNGELQTKPRFNFNPAEGCYGQFLDCSGPIVNDISIDERPDEQGNTSIYVTALLKNRDWLLVYQQKRSDALADQRRAQRISLLIFALGGLCIVAMSFLLSWRMVSRIADSDREKEMMNKQVIESGKLASLGELATGVAHEINNPVAIMVEEAGWIDDILSEPEFVNNPQMQELQRALKQINTQGKRCKDITTKLLSFARGSGSAIRDLQINEIIEEVVTISAQRAKYANIEMRSSLQPDLPEIKASETEMHQVFLNLVNNAIQAMEKTGGTINFKSYYREQEQKIVVEVADTGPGIPEAIIDRIFDPFFTTKPVGQGTGLGLSICYGIIRKMNGDIQVKSTVGKGTQFSIFFSVQ